MVFELRYDDAKKSGDRFLMESVPGGGVFGRSQFALLFQMWFTQRVSRRSNLRPLQNVNTPSMANTVLLYGAPFEVANSSVGDQL